LSTVLNQQHSLNFCYGTLKVWYSKLQHRKSISIKAKFDPNPKKTYLFFQFYSEFKPWLEKKWILDRNPQDKRLSPFCASSDEYGLINENWSDEPFFDLCSIGSMIFYTFFAIADETGCTDPKQWSYEVLCGFSWGMMSEDGTKINPIPVKGLGNERVKFLINLLRLNFPNGSFRPSKDCYCNFQ
jgi:hypothetical protein